MADQPIEQRIADLARQLWGDGEIKIREADGYTADVFVNGVLRHSVIAYDEQPLEAMERHLQRRVDEARKGRG